MSHESLLAVEGLTKSYRPGRPVVRDVTFQLQRGRTLGLVGPSGSGKSTLARCLAFFETPDAGRIRLEGRPVRRLLPRIQLIFQEPAAALNPRFSAAGIVAEPLLIQRTGTPAGQRELVHATLAAAGIPVSDAGKKALDFSGGERQRLAIARALVLDPQLLILDESLGGLDLSIRAQVINLLLEGQQRTGVALIVISHDLAMVSQWADEIAVMDGGCLVEHGPTAQVMSSPRHPRTCELLAASRRLNAL